LRWYSNRLNITQTSRDGQTVFERIISPHVAFTVPEENVDDLGPAWWSEAAGRALAAFVRANRLESAVNRHVVSFPRHRSELVALAIAHSPQ
jgi:hypothetical protein